MIFVTKLNGETYLLNSRLIESVEARPDTTIMMTSGKILIIKESMDILQDRIIEFESKIHKRMTL